MTTGNSSLIVSRWSAAAFRYLVRNGHSGVESSRAFSMTIQNARAKTISVHCWSFRSVYTSGMFWVRRRRNVRIAP